VLGRFADASGAYRFGPLAHDAVVATVHDDAGALVGQAVHFPGGPPLVPRDDLGLTAVAAPAGDGAYAVTLRAAALAWGVRVIAPGFRPTEDALTVVPGTPRTVMLRPRAAGADLEGATVRALNGTGDEPIAAAG
jgi:beta-mannosidase